ncbi:MAG: phosphoribosylamine--glycine ligase [Deferribacteres bacterium]|nr:phosphoribosylamine--glycine ligase [candidate division KSB1 bacterium]MCB9502555.1 phosphoribosylamine--glycine ligase [Deferribacteres bacterium]
MKILIIGSGAREHALAWKLHQSRQVTELFCAPGNPGIAEVASCVPIAVNNIEGLLDFAEKHQIDLTIPGPEAPLVAGIVDAFEAKGLTIFGPSKKAASLEGSKVFSKNFMKNYHIPAAASESFTDYEAAVAYAETTSYPCVVKADGLAAGKGAIIVHDFKEAQLALQRCMLKKEFGSAGSKVLIEEFLSGEEASVFALCDGKNYIVLAPAQDHKAIFDGDKGPNTGGMGTYAPAPIVTNDLLEKVEKEIIQPTISGMQQEGTAYKGVLFIGLMIENDQAKVLEYNCRFGDPEAQVILPLLKTDLAELLFKAAHGKIAECKIGHSRQSAVCVVLASGGYPGPYESGKVITGLKNIDEEQFLVFHSGTSLSANGELVTAGGRVLSVVAQSDNFNTSREFVYKAVDKIDFEGVYYRKDIGAKALKYF